ncbi:MAG: DUF1415 domain-containing protein [Gammaproteobacteria bacterium]|nr:DUF1415 domain-containing protein [Gammaproteobacteria bacterium]
MTSDQTIIEAVRHWVEVMVVGLNLCPFAKRELINERVRFIETQATSEEALLNFLTHELNLLVKDDSIETTLLIHPHVLQDFFDYNQFLDLVDALLKELNVEGVFQVASFHPDYQFGGTNLNAAENYTNRAPYPLLHIIREASLERAIDEYPDVNEIPERNVALMNEMGVSQLKALLES